LSFETVIIEPPTVPVVEAIIFTVLVGVVVPIPSLEPSPIYVFLRSVVPVAVKLVVAKLEVVAFVIVAFVEVILVNAAVKAVNIVVKKLVVVAFVNVAFVEVR
jgi:hypothetical protein